MPNYVRKESKSGANGAAIGAREGNRRAPKSESSNNTSYNPNWLTRGIENFTRTKMERKDVPYNWFNHKEVVTSPYGDFDPTEGYIPFTNSGGRFLNDKQKKTAERNTLRSHYTKDKLKETGINTAASVATQIALQSAVNAIPFPAPMKIPGMVIGTILAQALAQKIGNDLFNPRNKQILVNQKKKEIKDTINSLSNAFDTRGLREIPVTKRLQKRNNKYF